MGEGGGLKINLGRVTLTILMLCLFLYPFSKNLQFLAFKKMLLLKKPWTILTASFLHANIMHLIYNMYSLFIFGNVLEVNNNSKITLLIILSSAIVGNLGFSLFSERFTVGLSGAIYGLIGAVTVLNPNTKIPLPLGVIFIPGKAKFAGPLIAFGELIVSFLAFDNIAHSAHFFGFIGGVVFALWTKSAH